MGARHQKYAVDQYRALCRVGADLAASELRVARQVVGKHVPQDLPLKGKEFAYIPRP